MPNEKARLYVIGDIHGRLDLLDQLIDAIKRDVGQVASDCLTVTLGDYIDRGPDSRGVIERLLANPFPTPYIALKGNHELLLESFLVDPVVAEHWRRFGAAETLHSYGVPVSGLMAGKAYEEAAAGLRDAMPAQHTRFLRSLRTSYSNDKYFFCHAGVRPGVSLEEQSDEDLLWIRGEFLNSTIDFGKVVVHGHTPVKEPEVLPNRINIDTGAFATGHLTCVVLDKGGHRFIET
jgi:diadenosine tetraphosphatase ApaH/serine/threonine PP2A family protein phosphatase